MEANIIAPHARFLINWEFLNPISRLRLLVFAVPQAVFGGNAEAEGRLLKY